MIARTLFINNPCFLKLENNQLVAQYSHVAGQEDLPNKTAPIEDLGFVILEHKQISITHPLLAKLSEQNVALITCNEKQMPNGMLLSLESNTLQSERFKWQIAASEPLKKQLWQQVIVAKIQNQAKVLELFGIENQYLLEQSKKVKSGDSENAEAKCSLHYWQRLFPPSWNFYRKRDGLPPNNLLNYGYAIIRSTLARALVGSGLLPTLGIFHRNKYNAYCLADDIMEPYRPFVDREVRNIINETSAIDPMSQEQKIRLAQLITCDVGIEKQTSPLSIGAHRTAVSLVKCYAGESRKLALPYFLDV